MCGARIQVLGINAKFQTSDIFVVTYGRKKILSVNKRSVSFLFSY